MLICVQTNNFSAPYISSLFYLASIVCRFRPPPDPRAVFATQPLHFMR